MAGEKLVARLIREQETGKIDAMISTAGSPGSAGVGQILLAEGGSLVIEVDGEGVSGTEYQGEEPRAFTIRQVPDSVTRSCVYCRKLLDAKRYQESIQWYRDFISEFGERYMVDDAQYEIANIHDQYLRDYPSALKEYKTLLARYPDSGKAPQAAQRVAYLESYSDHGFAPLRIFEEAKNETYQRDSGRAVTAVASILSQYPGAGIEPEVLYWLGYTLAPRDLRGASTYYQRLIKDHPASRESAWIGLGDAYYQHSRYKAALDAYRQAQASVEGGLNFGLLDKVRKSQRNIVRKAVLFAALLVLAVAYALALLVKPRFLKRREMMLALYLALSYLAAATLIWAGFFRGYPELLRIFPVLLPVAATVPAVGAALSRKLSCASARPCGVSAPW